MYRSLVIGAGEVGRSLVEVLRRRVAVHVRDIKPVKIEGYFDVIHICLRYSNQWSDIVARYLKKYPHGLVDICSTVPPGTTEEIGSNACHSTTRGLHPNLAESIRTFTKHIGGPRAGELAKYYNYAGIRTQTHATARTTELAHILSNSIYGVNLMLADELNDICRQYGVDYQEAVIDYNRTSNEGYAKLGHKSKTRMLLSPPNGHIGGHCIVHGANLLTHKGQLLERLANYG